MIVTLTKLCRLITITYKYFCILQKLLVYTAFITLYLLDKPAAYTSSLISIFIILFLEKVGLSDWLKTNTVVQQMFYFFLTKELPCFSVNVVFFLYL